MLLGAVALALVLFACPLAAEAQEATKVWRIGVLGTIENPDALRQGLREFGYVEGQNITLEWRGWEGSTLADFAAALVRLPVDVIITGNNPAVAAAQRATKTIPIVMMYASDPVGTGFVTSLARPGGNVTGLTSQSTEATGKRLQLLREAVPNLSRVAVLWDPNEPGRRDMVKEAEFAAQAQGVQVQLVEVRRPDDFSSAFAAITHHGAGGVVLMPSSLILRQRSVIAARAITSRLPMICVAPSFVESGCLMSYSPNFADLHRRAAYFVDKILKGARPADLPVEQPTKFELVINLKTAKALGLTIPQLLLSRADHVVQ